MENNELLLERIVKLEAAIEAKDSEIKEIKAKQEALTASFNAQALAVQDIKADVRYMRDGFGKLEAFIDEMKNQPRKELNKIISTVISTLIGGVIGVTIGKIFK